MILVLAIIATVVILLIFVTMQRGMEAALPYFAFIATFCPLEAQIQLPGLFNLTTQRIGLVILIVLYLVKKPQSDPKSGGTPLLFLIVLEIVWTAVACANSNFQRVSWKAFLAQLLDFYVFYYIFYHCLTSIASIKKVLLGFLWAMIVCAVFGSFESYTEFRTLGLFPQLSSHFGYLGADIERGFRVTATFPHAILYGGALSIAIPLAMYFLSETKKTSAKVVYWVAIMLFFLNIYKAMSRGPWMAMGVSVLLYGILGTKKVRTCFAVLTVLTISVLVIRPGVWDTVKNVYISTLDPDSPMGSSYEYRYQLMDMAKRELATSSGHMLWGFGPETFFYLGLMGPNENNRMVPYNSCDSAWVQIAMEEGYVGLILSVILLSVPLLIALWTYIRTPPPANQLILVLSLNMLAYYFLMVSVALYGWGQPGYIIWMLIACSIAYSKLVGLEPAESPVSADPARRGTGKNGQVGLSRLVTIRKNQFSR